MNTREQLHHDLRSLRASDFAARIRDQLRRHPTDPELRWALAELERTECVLHGARLQRTRWRLHRGTRSMLS